MVVDLVQELTAQRLLAIVRGRDARGAAAAACRLVDLGVRLLEVSLSSSGALETIEAAVARSSEHGGRSLVGAGTVLSRRDLDMALEAGASFVVTPALTEALEESVARDVPVLAGALTPTEVLHAWRAGATAVKVFPASAVPVGYVRALRDPFPDVPLVPVGGVTADAARTYLADGAVAVGVGSPLLGDAPDGRDLDGLAKRLEDFVEAVRS